MCKTPPPRTALPGADRPRDSSSTGGVFCLVLLDTPSGTLGHSGSLGYYFGSLRYFSGSLGHSTPWRPLGGTLRTDREKSGSPGYKIGSLGYNFRESWIQKLGVLDTISGSLGYLTPFNLLSIRYLQNPLTFLILLTFLLEWRGVYFGYPPPLLFCRKGDLQTPIQSSRCVPGYRLLFES